MIFLGEEVDLEVIWIARVSENVALKSHLHVDLIGSGVKVLHWAARDIVVARDKEHVRKQDGAEKAKRSLHIRGGNLGAFFVATVQSQRGTHEWGVRIANACQQDISQIRKEKEDGPVTDKGVHSVVPEGRTTVAGQISIGPAVGVQNLGAEAASFCAVLTAVRLNCNAGVRQKFLHHGVANSRIGLEHGLEQLLEDDIRDGITLGRVEGTEISTKQQGD